MVGCSTTKRKRGGCSSSSSNSPTTTRTEFAADQNHPTAARIGCDSPTDGDGASSEICSIRDGSESTRRQSSLLSFFAKEKRTKTPQSKPTLDRHKGDSIRIGIRIRAGTSDDESSKSFPPSPPSPPSPPPLVRKTHLFFCPPHNPGTKTVPREQMPPVPSSESASSSKPNSNSKPKPKSLTQVYIDCGQSRFGQILCEKCGMLYVPGIAEDELQHKQLCQAHTLGIPCFRGTVKSGKRLPDDAAAKDKANFKEGRNNGGSSVVMWKPSFPSRNRSRSKHACPNGLKPITTTKEPNRCTDDNHSNNLPSQWPLLARIVSKDLGTNEDTTLNHLSNHTVFLYIGSNSNSSSNTTTTRASGAKRSASGGRSRILGVATVQVLGYQYGVPAYEMINLHERSLEPVASTPPLGIGLLWTHPLERHRGIATLLVDAARGHAIFGMKVARTCVAFSSPTQAGYEFALRYGLPDDGDDGDGDLQGKGDSKRQSEVALCRKRRGPLVYEMDL